MNREDIIRIAREAGFTTLSINEDLWGPYLERFAALVAAHEREECAKLCEAEIERVRPLYSVTAENCTKVIRARGEK
jgi:hypothetical protein